MENINDKLATFDFSKLHPYSLGLVYEDAINEEIIKVYPIEILTNEKDEDLWKEYPNEFNKYKVPEFEVKYKIKMKEYLDEEKDIVEEFKVKRYKYIRAKYLYFNNFNAFVPPVVRKKEIVLIWRFSNTNLYYWSTILNDYRLRKQETRITALNNMVNCYGSVAFDNMYYVVASTIEKVVKFHTGVDEKGNEHTPFDLVVDTGRGTIEFYDEFGNEIKWSSNPCVNENRLELNFNKNQNCKDGRKERVGFNVYFNTVAGVYSYSDTKNNSMVMKALDQHYSVNIADKYTINVEKGDKGNGLFDLNASENVKIKAGKKISLKAKKITLN